MGKKSKTKPPKPPKDASAAGSGTIAARGTSEAAQRRAAVAAAARAGQPIQVPDLSGLRLISAEVVAALGGEGTRTTIEDVEKAEAGLAGHETSANKLRDGADAAASTCRALLKEGNDVLESFTPAQVRSSPDARKQITQALRKFEKARAASLRCQLREDALTLERLALGHIATAHFKLGDLRMCVTLSEQALELCEAAGDDDRAVVNRRNRDIACVGVANDLFEAAHRAVGGREVKEPDDATAAKALYTEAKAQVTEAWEGFGRRISDPAMRGKVERAYCAAMGNCWFRLRDAEKAVEIYQRGQALSIAADDPVDIKVAEESLARAAPIAEYVTEQREIRAQLEQHVRETVLAALPAGLDLNDPDVQERCEMVAGVVRKGMLEDARRHPDDPAAQNVIAAYETFEHGWSEEARIASTELLAEATAHAWARARAAPGSSASGEADPEADRERFVEQLAYGRSE